MHATASEIDRWCQLLSSSRQTLGGCLHRIGQKTKLLSAQVIYVSCFRRGFPASVFVSPFGLRGQQFVKLEYTRPDGNRQYTASAIFWRVGR